MVFSQALFCQQNGALLLLHFPDHGKAVFCPKGIGLRILFIDPQEDPFLSNIGTDPE